MAEESVVHLRECQPTYGHRWDDKSRIVMHIKRFDDRTMAWFKTAVLCRVMANWQGEFVFTREPFPRGVHD